MEAKEEKGNTQLVKLAIITFTFSWLASAQMVRNDSIGNDPAKEKLCVERAISGHRDQHTVPFEIDQDYVLGWRRGDPDAAFIAVESNTFGSADLIHCQVNPGTGKYGPMGREPERPGRWRLIKPEQFQPGYYTQVGINRVVDRCRDAVTAKINRIAPDQSSITGAPKEVSGTLGLYHVGVLIGGRRAERYDIAASGRLLYKTTGLDMGAVNFTCLLSPMLDVKAIEIK
jgi:hypothetical protein